ncbi:MAG: hypothetical protein A2787_06715 [Omnitrophica WOR_2 bacterium RIFCSPHIGHO2_01_FULL_48_9]|nr:MAG: hypothetical protein A3D10_09570 [Omnitrophica WOR_2 bacterium RIFCSPHIGHO2_02_FULL_48_11]OGX29956.1 MAG: hypothetical protein A2787_06715 [Omnitrophica WOR_2 bacterium RIFCSPHIGHO2_01_FULL_48_9]
MNSGTFEILEKKIIIRLQDRVCETSEELVLSKPFHEVVRRAVAELSRRNSLLLKIFDEQGPTEEKINILIQTLHALIKMSSHVVPGTVKGAEIFFRDEHLLSEFIEYLYNHWRSYERFVICDSTGKDLDKRPYRTFHGTVEHLSHLIRWTYRDIQENITHSHPRIYRQVIAGAEVATISIPKEIPFADPLYKKLNEIPLIRQILLYPPLILNPPMNKRTGKFERIKENPLKDITISRDEWLCYPAKVGPLLILIYFHIKFAELGLSLCNLFKLAEDEELEKTPDAVYLFGVPGNSLDKYSSFPTVFYDDEKNDILIGAVPNHDDFGYFGYLKKMVLTLHNIIMMKRGRLPYHGALVRILLKGNHSATILFIGDTGAGKSETLEAFRGLGEEYIQDIIIIADDMGSFEINSKGEVIGYGTEIGAFLRLDDLQPGYALGQIDRAIIMSANQINARIILPVTTYETLIKGHKIDYILYANNYEEIDEEHPILERFSTPQEAINIFREGTVMSKGTTTTQGIVHTYYGNVFGPPQYKELHEPLAQKFFHKFFEQGIIVGQLRTRLGLAGWERKGPEEAAKVLLEKVRNS